MRGFEFKEEHRRALSTLERFDLEVKISKGSFGTHDTEGIYQDAEDAFIEWCSAQPSRHRAGPLRYGDPHSFCSKREQFCQEAIIQLYEREAYASLGSGAPRQYGY
jgi:hypothetical protein